MHHFHLQHHGPVRSLHYPLAARQVNALVERFRPDVVNAHFASGYGYLAALALKDDGPPLAVHLWGSDVLIVPHKSPLHRRKTVRALRAADHVFADSDYLIDAARELAPLPRTSVIPWGIESRYLPLHRFDYDLGSPLRIIVPRTQTPIYNNQFLLKTLRPLITAGKVTMTFPDFGAEVESFRAAVGDLRDRGVMLYPRLDRDAFIALLAGHDVYLSAARSDSSPASLIEAMALGLIPIAADIPGVREWLSVENGYLFEQDDPESLTGAINAVVESYGQTDLRRANLKRVQRNAVFEDNIAATLDAMKELC